MEIMMLKGPLIRYELLSRNRFMFAKDATIRFPEKIPCVWNYDTNDSTSVIGYAEVIPVENGYDVVVSSHNKIFNEFMWEMKKIPCGGFFNRVNCQNGEDGIRIVTSAYMPYMSVFLSGDEELYLKILR